MPARWGWRARSKRKREGLEACVIDKGALVNSLVGYPSNMEFFSTPELIEIGGYPFPVQGYKPTREEAIEYYRGVTDREALDVKLYERVLEVRGDRGDFTVVTSRDAHAGRNVVVSTGFFDQPNLMGVPGEELPKVTHYYREPYPYVRQKVAIIGAKNSAAKAALDCYRHGAQVTMIVRSGELSDKIKYWIKPDLENRIKEGSIKALFNTAVQEIRESSIAASSRPRVRARSRTTGCSRPPAITRTTSSWKPSASNSGTTGTGRPPSTKPRSRPRGPGCISREPCAAAI